MHNRIYLDNNASTILDARVANVIIQEMQEGIGNPSSVHFFGQEVRNRLTKARRIIAAFLGVKAAEIIFTSGGTEAANLFIQGLFGVNGKGHIITSNVEHSCVYHTIKTLEERGWEATFLSPGLGGAVRPEQVRDAIRPTTQLIAIMAVNNETGVKTDVAAIAKIAEGAKIPLFVDAVAWMGKELFQIPKGVTGMSFSGHKFHALQGTGFLFVRQGTKLSPLLIGGGQEYQRRGGTENVIGIIALAEAVRLLDHELAESSNRMLTLRDYLERELISQIPDCVVNGQGPRVVNTVNISFPGIEGESLLMNLDLAGIAVSHGSACSSGALEPSRILLNMGIEPYLASSSIRFSLSRFTTLQEINQCIEIVVKVVSRLKLILSPGKLTYRYLQTSSD